MAEVKPFRAVRYGEGAGPLEALVAPPYDVISPEQREELLARNPHNVVHLTLPDDETEAGRLWADWRDEGVLAEDAEPGFWWLSQDYVGPDGVARTREGLVAALRIEPYENRVVLPHERTHRGPKEGRLRLLRETRAQLEPLFFLYEGGPPARRPEREPDLEADGARLWQLSLQRTNSVAEAFAHRQLLIADGHHRYETAVAYHEETGTPESAYVLAVLVSLEDPGLMIFPTHRVFEHVERNGGSPYDDVKLALGDLDAQPPDHAGGVLYRRQGIELLHGRPGQLDVELAEDLDAKGVTYTASIEDAIESGTNGDAEGALLVRPTRVEDVYAWAQEGRVMPQKTTYFYPKLVSGLLFLPLD
jgi:uncharacterized protein (DUF1015 family)